MDLDMYITASEAIAAAYFINPSISNTNITASQIVAVITVMLLK
jgi:hypothetical protein